MLICCLFWGATSRPASSCLPKMLPKATRWQSATVACFQLDPREEVEQWPTVLAACARRGAASGLFLWAVVSLTALHPQTQLHPGQGPQGGRLPEPAASLLSSYSPYPHRLHLLLSLRSAVLTNPSDSGQTEGPCICSAFCSRAAGKPSCPEWHSVVRLHTRLPLNSPAMVLFSSLSPCVAGWEREEEN